MSSQKVVIVTGASRGIGLAIAHYLLKNSHKVIVVARSQGPLEELRKQYPEQVKVLTGDLADFSLGQKANDLATDTWKRLDGLVVNHGILEPVKRVADTNAEEWRHCFDVNVFSAVSMIQACLPALREAQGRIVLCSSGAATGAYQGWAAYGASKAALNHLAMSLAVEEPNVTTVALRPGVVDTDMQKSIRETHNETMDPKDAAKFAELKRTGGLLRPDQPGNVMARLALEATKDLNGSFVSWNDEKLSEYQDR